MLNAQVSAMSRNRLLSDFSAVENTLRVELRNTTAGQHKTEKYKPPVCPPDPPEVEGYVILGFDDHNRLAEFTLEGVMP